MGSSPLFELILLVGIKKRIWEHKNFAPISSQD